MTEMHTALKPSSTHVAIMDQPDQLAAVREPGCGAAILQRRIDPKFQAWLDALPPEQLPSARLILRPEAVAQAVGHLCDMVEMPRVAHRFWLQDDIADLAARFATLMRTEFLRLRLDVIDTNACSKFHIDAVLARLICTYRGTGTQYGLSVDGTPPETAATVSTGDPMILRGTLWQDDAPSHLLHRSPPIAGTGETRLVLVLDPILEPEDDY